MVGIPGIILQFVGWFMSGNAAGAAGRNATPEMSIPALLVTLTGTVLLIVGLSLYAKAKGYHPAFGLFGLLSIIGLIVLGVLPNKLKVRK
jgi:hypothetical protein